MSPSLSLFHNRFGWSLLAVVHLLVIGSLLFSPVAAATLPPPTNKYRC